MRKTDVIVRVAGLAIAGAALLGAGMAVSAPAAEAATVSCKFSGLTSMKVKNESCSKGAYAHTSVKNGSTVENKALPSGGSARDGAWVAKGKTSNNDSGKCWAYPTMIFG